MHRNQNGSSWIAKAATMCGAAVMTSLLTGAMLGTLGGLLEVDARVAIASLGAVIGLAVGTREFAFGRVPLPQCDRETPQAWVHRGALRWALRNGFAFGCGATTRIGFWLWYVIPASAFLIGGPGMGAAIYASYGAARTLGAVGVLILFRVGPRFLHRDDVAVWLLQRRPVAERIGAGQLVVVSAYVVAALAL